MFCHKASLHSLTLCRCAFILLARTQKRFNLLGITDKCLKLHDALPVCNTISSTAIVRIRTIFTALHGLLSLRYIKSALPAPPSFLVHRHSSQVLLILPGRCTGVLLIRNCYSVVLPGFIALTSV